ncbi:MAG: 50S ribosomal protein L16 [Candidatus Pacebacteria bacterium]|nr:50S ribosomal protein L16 [Candidatus Paceibacterota bacterium]NUQ57174.1 50S ribosomal protein L16 [Candidatus Paceibacter sp.]
MYFPKKVKYRKWHRMRENPLKKKLATRGNELDFGSFGLMAQEAQEIKSNQLEAARKTMARFTQNAGKIWIRIFADMPITRKPLEVGMGKGKGDPAFFVSRVRPGTVIFEIDGLGEEQSREALRKGASKLPVKTKIISR